MLHLLNLSVFVFLFLLLVLLLPRRRINLRCGRGVRSLLRFRLRSRGRRGDSLLSLVSWLLGFLWLLVASLSLLLLLGHDGRLLLEAFLNLFLALGVSELIQRSSGCIL